MRGFKGGAVSNDGGAVGDFARLDDAPHSLVLMNPAREFVGAVRQLPEKGARQYGRFVLVRRAMKAKEGVPEPRDAPPPPAPDASSRLRQAS